MDLFAILIMAIGLSMDAFAVSVTNGLAIKKSRLRAAFKTGLFFGFFQAIMPVIGYLIGAGLFVYIYRFDHWIAFFLLVFVGIKMIVEAKEEKNKKTNTKHKSFYNGCCDQY